MFIIIEASMVELVIHSTRAEHPTSFSSSVFAALTIDRSIYLSLSRTIDTFSTCHWFNLICNAHSYTSSAPSTPIDHGTNQCGEIESRQSDRQSVRLSSEDVPSSSPFDRSSLCVCRCLEDEEYLF